MKLNKINIKDKQIFDRFLGQSQHQLSVYAFENTYIWKGLFDIYWKVIKNNLCVFFKDKIGCFLYFPPQGKMTKPEVIKEVFGIMDNFNKDKNISRIENVEEKDLPFYRDLGYEVKFKSCDYLCQRNDLVQLKGNRFKSKRACFNYFIKNYEFKYLPFSLEHRDDCLKLYNRWMKERQLKYKDLIYQRMLMDNRICLKTLLKVYKNLNLKGKIVKVNRKIKGFSFGFKLNQDTFCILYEITDLSVKGLSQFIFRKFCYELKDYKYINIMDDSGLENLKKVKLSYHPIRLIPAYTVKKKNEQKFR